MTLWVWVPIEALYIVHDRQISRHGGAPGIRDKALLEAACARPLNKSKYEKPDVYVLAAAYGFGIAKAHAFVDGNKRTAFVATATFLRLNGVTFRPIAREGVDMMEGLASGEISEAKFADWLRKSGQV